MALEGALQAGVTVLDFWEMTPWETQRALSGLKGRMDWGLTLEHTNAVLQRTSKIPPLESLLGRVDDRIQDEETSIAKLKTFLGVGAGT